MSERTDMAYAAIGEASDHDIYDSGISSCCSAKVYMGGRCRTCQEHCDIITE